MKIISVFTILAPSCIILLLTCCNQVNKANTSTAVLHETDNPKTTTINDSLCFADGFFLADTLQLNDDKHFAYGTFIILPKLLNKNGEYELLNRKIAADFESIVKKASANPKANKDEYHKIYYDYYLHDSIISIKITDLYAWHLSEATTEFTIYHFDFKNNKLLTTQEMFAVFGMSQVPVLSAIAEQCTMPPDYSEPLFRTDWFNQVKWKNLNQLKFYLNNGSKAVIIYPLAENGIEAEQIIQ